MRTTIEITDEQRGQLLELAAKRGEKGFSRLVQEALDRYLAESAGRGKRIRDALEVLGTLSAGAAAKMETAVRHSRGSWR